MLFAFMLVTTMYVTFVFSYTEMACAIPRAGGVFVYSERGFWSGCRVSRWGCPGSRICFCTSGNCDGDRGLCAELDSWVGPPGL